MSLDVQFWPFALSMLRVVPQFMQCWPCEASVHRSWCMGHMREVLERPSVWSSPMRPRRKRRWARGTTPRRYRWRGWGGRRGRGQEDAGREDVNGPFETHDIGIHYCASIWVVLSIVYPDLFRWVTEYNLVLCCFVLVTLDHSCFASKRNPIHWATSFGVDSKVWRICPIFPFSSESSCFDPISIHKCDKLEPILGSALIIFISGVVLFSVACRFLTSSTFGCFLWSAYVESSLLSWLWYHVRLWKLR